ncbi:MAG: hypothetical protein ABSA84_08400 [Gammaproteobacteria bacterium]
MSGYQYYEFCRIKAPISQKAREEMASLSSRANVGTHGASYVYNYGNFRGDSKKLLLKYFDVFFYLSNYGVIQLMFKYKPGQVNIEELKKYDIKHVISCEQYDKGVLLEIYINKEEGFGWTEGEGLLADLLPLYSEIKAKNYQFLRLITAINNELDRKVNDTSSNMISEMDLSSAQQAFLDIIDLS